MSASLLERTSFRKWKTRSEVHMVATVVNPVACLDVPILANTERQVHYSLRTFLENTGSIEMHHT
jgi:hypothetical protein